MAKYGFHIFALAVLAAFYLATDAQERPPFDHLFGEPLFNSPTICDFQGEKTGVLFKIEEVRFSGLDGNQSRCEIIFSHENLFEKPVYIDADDTYYFFQVRLWDLKGNSLYQGPPGLFKGGWGLARGLPIELTPERPKEYFHKVFTPGVVTHAKNGPLLLQVLHYVPGSDYILVSPPVLVDATNQLNLESTEAVDAAGQPSDTNP